MRDETAILLPMTSVLRAATPIVAQGAIEEQYGQERHIEIRKVMMKAARQRPRERGRQLREIMKMARYLPPTRREQQALLHLPVGGSVLGDDQLWRAAPDGGGAVRAANALALSVGVIVDIDGYDSRDEQRDGDERTERDWMAHEIERL